MKPYYQDSHVTIYHGDCREITAWLSADVLITDPPYGVSWLGYANQGQRRISIAGDDDASVRDSALALWGDKPALVFGSWRIPRPSATRNRLIWYKRGHAPGLLNAPFMSQDEEIYVLGGGFLSTSPPMRSVIETNESRSGEVKRIGHPTPKPIHLLEILIRRCIGPTIADPFCGSGSTLLAARNLNRKAIGIELEEKYCEIAAERCRQEVLDLGGNP
jgi:site-specific DNA-methyltransferase (adenine-specific)